MSCEEKHSAIHIPTLIAISITAWALVNILHEIVGHAGVSLLMGVPVKGVSTTTIFMEMDWDQFVAERGLNPVRLIVTGGTLVNILTGALALLALGWKRITNVTMRYALWLFAAFSMVIVAGNMVTSHLLGFGDWIEFLSGLEARNFWQIGVTLVGLAILAAGYLLSLRLRLPRAKEDRRALLAMTAIPVATMMVVQTLSVVASPFAALPPETNHLLASVFAYIHFIVWVVVVNLLPGQSTDPATEVIQIQRSNGWLVLGMAVFVFFVLVLGPGMGSFAGDPRLG